MINHTSNLALYLHIPYCRTRCSYCDFNAHALPSETTGLFERYAEALIKDIKNQKKAEVSTIFWGGGTPSLMPLEPLSEIVRALDERFTWSAELENTIEANPGQISAETFEQYLKLGINRLSIGAQSFHSSHLELVGRVHSPKDIQTTYETARSVGFSNISLDLIYGFPQQSLDQWKETLQKALELNPNHFSIYQLTIEPSTRLEVQLAKGELELPPEDDMIAMDDWAEKTLTEAGYSRYEVSNWCKPGCESQHNQAYWSDRSYLGLGCGAVSFLNGWRFERIKAPAYYERALAQGRSPVIFAEKRSADGALKDHLMMGLRVKNGVSVNVLEGRYPGFKREELEAFFERLPSAWWRRREDSFELTRRGWDFHSEVTIELMNVMFSFS